MVFHKELSAIVYYCHILSTESISWTLWDTRGTWSRNVWCRSPWQFLGEQRWALKSPRMITGPSASKALDTLARSFRHSWNSFFGWSELRRLTERELILKSSQSDTDGTYCQKMSSDSNNIRVFIYQVVQIWNKICRLRQFQVVIFNFLLQG